MKKFLIALSSVLYMVLFMNYCNAQHTFSIVAVDSITHEVGSAGASFVPDAPLDVLNGVFSVNPGIGAVHTQAHYNENNQYFANLLMTQNFSPQQIIDYMVTMDADADPSQRQYIIVDLVDGGRTAAYTGAACPDYANHILGKNYAIAGNILYGQDVLDSMQAGFLNTPGTLADKLMAALLGGKNAGGDKRGEEYGLSSLVASLKVAKPANSKDSLYLSIVIPYDSYSDWTTLPDPVDSLHTLYKQWRDEPAVSSILEWNAVPLRFELLQNYPNPFNSSTIISYQIPQKSFVNLSVYNAAGQLLENLENRDVPPGNYSIVWDSKDVGTGIFFIKLSADAFVFTRKMLVVK